MDTIIGKPHQQAVVTLTEWKSRFALLGKVPRRQYLPKKTGFSTVTNADLVWIMDRLNLRPRKCLDFQTPFEVFFNIPVALDM